MTTAEIFDSAALCWSNASIYLRLCASSIDAAGGDYRGFNEASCSKAPSVSFEITAPPVSFEITYWIHRLASSAICETKISVRLDVFARFCVFSWHGCNEDSFLSPFFCWRYYVFLWQHIHRIYLMPSINLIHSFIHLFIHSFVNRLSQQTLAARTRQIWKGNANRGTLERSQIYSMNEAEFTSFHPSRRSARERKRKRRIRYGCVCVVVCGRARVCVCVCVCVCGCLSWMSSASLHEWVNEFNERMH